MFECSSCGGILDTPQKTSVVVIGQRWDGLCKDCLSAFFRIQQAAPFRYAEANRKLLEQ